MKSFINIRNARFFAYHGVMPQERVVGNEFLLDLTLEVDIVTATESDKLEDTVNYAEVYVVIKKEMDEPSQLLEHVAGRIIKALRKEFPEVKQIDISLTKCHPPIKGEMEGIGVRLISEQ